MVVSKRLLSNINNFGFDVERASEINGSPQNWNKIGFVVGNGNSSGPKNYSFTDNPKTGNKYYYGLKQIDSNGQTEYSDVISLDIKIPNQYVLYQNYPNPFNPTTSITYNLPVDGNVTIKVFDILGNEVAVLINDNQKAGAYTIPFYAKEFASGIYICKMNSSSFSSTVKMMLIK